MLDAVRVQYAAAVRDMRAAFESPHKNVVRMVAKMVRRYFRDTDDAAAVEVFEEAVSEAMLAAAKWPYDPERGDVGGWAYHMALIGARAAIGAHRCRGLVEVPDGEYPDCRHLEELLKPADRDYADEDSWDDACAKTDSGAWRLGEPEPVDPIEQANTVEHILSHFKPRTQEILRLRMDGFTQDEIAARLGITERRIKQIMHEVRAEIFPQNRR